MRPSHLLATALTLSSLSAAWPWPEAFGGVKALDGIENMFYRRDSSGKDIMGRVNCWTCSDVVLLQKLRNKTPTKPQRRPEQQPQKQMTRPQQQQTTRPQRQQIMQQRRQQPLVLQGRTQQRARLPARLPARAPVRRLASRLERAAARRQTNQPQPRNTTRVCPPAACP